MAQKNPEVKIYRSGLTLTEGTDYTATYKGDQVNAGTFTVTFTGIGKYTGSVTKNIPFGQPESTAALPLVRFLLKTVFMTASLRNQM